MLGNRGPDWEFQKLVEALKAEQEMIEKMTRDLRQAEENILKRKGDDMTAEGPEDKPKTRGKKAQGMPKVVMMVKSLQAGNDRSMVMTSIGLIECPHCGQTHYLASIEVGEHVLYCGTELFGLPEYPHIQVDGTSAVEVVKVV